ncbi:MAG: acyl-CoA reductase [Prevotellaceae bacterium]|jgi:hypothetical protein|nr:acyl-CoA reductase [Prevotellaceae bacterium]
MKIAMNGEYLVEALADLGEIVVSYLDGTDNAGIEAAVRASCANNHWFTENNVRAALRAVAETMLDAQKLSNWLKPYPANAENPRRVGLIQAGNIPMVGFHDLLSVLASGNIATVKPSSKDKHLAKTLCGILASRFPALKERIVFSEVLPQNIDMAIAVGSNNSARYFRADYGHLPLLIRKNRYSAAVLDGNETNEELEALGNDIFSYFGLGCRNVSNIFLPADFDLALLLQSMSKHSEITEHREYRDCYRYQRAVAQLSGDDYIDSGFVILRERPLSFPSIATLNFAKYGDRNEVKALLASRENEIQCIVGHANYIGKSVPFGQTQRPELNDFADGIDTVRWINEN